MCQECTVALVDSLPDEEGSAAGRMSVDLVEIFTGPFFQVALFRGYLEEQGIPSVIYEADPYSMMVGADAQPPFQRLQVSREDYEKHREMIDDWKKLVNSAAEDSALGNSEEQ